jgi:hypothetical protein
VAERVRVREIDDDEGRRLVRIVRRGIGSVVTWRRPSRARPAFSAWSLSKLAEFPVAELPYL